MQVGITGGIGSGKSLVCKIFQCLGIPVYDADSHAKELMTTDGILISNIKKEFGPLSYNSDGSLNRSYLSQEVFNDQEKLNVLNSLVHPSVGEDYNKWVGKMNSYPYLIKEAALLFETGSDAVLDKVILVHAPTALRVRRILKRDRHRTERQIMAIVNNQMPEDEKMKLADFIVTNDEKSLLIPQVVGLHLAFLSSAQGMSLS